MSELIRCPDPTCGAPARIVDRWTFGSTDGPVEHVQTNCERGHWFTPLAETITASKTAIPGEVAAALPA